MPVDFRRFVRDLTAAADLVADGRAAGLVAIRLVVEAGRVAATATGATFTEYVGNGGRVVVADGSMAWALGQPVAPELIPPVVRLGVEADPEASPRLQLVVGLAPALVAPLTSHGVVTFGGWPVRSGNDTLGYVHLYFDRTDVDEWPDAQLVLRLLAQAVRDVVRFDPAPRHSSTVADEEDRSLFLAVAGHELRTPVTVIKGYASMLADRWELLDDSKRREAARVLTLRADELHRLVDRLLGVSVSNGSTGWLVRTIAFDPGAALRGAVDELPPDLRATVCLRLPTALPTVSGDPTILTSIIAELVTNAVRSTLPAGESPLPTSPPGGDPFTMPLVDVDAGADSHTVSIRVSDRGVGIDATQAESAFEQFWRGRHDGDARTGVGLGLYLVRRLVERQGGWVSLRPRDGGGTVAEVRLRRADGPHR